MVYVSRDQSRFSTFLHPPIPGGKFASVSTCPLIYGGLRSMRKNEMCVSDASVSHLFGDSLPFVILRMTAQRAPPVSDSGDSPHQKK